MTLFSKPSKVTLLVSGAFALSLSLAVAYFLKKKLGNGEDEYNIDSYYKLQQTVAEVEIPVEVVGSIIGRNGQSVDDIQKNTTTTIEFKIKNVKGADLRIAVIRGDAKNVKTAAQMLRTAVDEQLSATKFKARTAKQPEILKPAGATSEDNAVSSKSASTDKVLAEKSISRDNIKCAVDETTSVVEVSPKSQPESQSSDKVFRQEAQKNRSPVSAKFDGNSSSENVPAVDQALQFKSQPEKQLKEPQVADKRNLSPQNPPKSNIGEKVPSKELQDGSQTLPSRVESKNVHKSSNVKEMAKHEQRRQKFQELIPTASDGYFEVFICHINSPGQFWIQSAIDPVAGQLDKMLEDITSFYKDENNNEKLRVERVKEGDIMASTFEEDEDWYRVLVLSVSGDAVNIKSLDYGGCYKVSTSSLRALTDDFLLCLPFQAVECSLAGVRPVGTKWTEEATKSFGQLTHYELWEKVVAKIVSEEPNGEEGIKVVKLVDTSKPKDIFIAEELVKLGLAERVQEE